MFFKNLLLRVVRFSIQKNTTQVVQKGKNLINPGPQDPIAFGYYFPRQWNQQKIYSLLDPTRKQILSIKIVQNKLGLSTGKILFTFRTTEVMAKYLDRYDEDFIQTEDTVQKVVLKRFQLKNDMKRKQKAEYNKKYGVHLVNLDFDIDNEQIQRLAEDFGQIQFIDLPMKDNTMNRGSARIYFKAKSSSIQFRDFSDGLKYKERKLKCSLIKTEQELTNEKVFKEVQAPKIVMKWNQELYKRMVKKQAEGKTDNNYQNKVV